VNLTLNWNLPSNLCQLCHKSTDGGGGLWCRSIGAIPCYSLTLWWLTANLA